MAFDQNITYRVNVDDTNFQAKLTQMRANMDASMGGGGGGGFSAPLAYGMMSMMGGGGGYGGGFGGGAVADFGSQIRPVTYTPPAISLQPHFGMFQIQQSLAQAGLGAMGPIGIGASGAVTNMHNGGIFGQNGLLFGPSPIPNNVTTAEYMALSARGFADRAGDAAAIGAVTVGSTAASLAVGGVGAAVGSSLFSSGLGKAVGGLAGGLIGGAVVSAYTGAVTDMMADNRQMQSALAAGSFRFFNGGGDEVDRLTGRGMGRRTRASVATSIQGMEMQDLRFGQDEYKQVLEGGMQMDLFSGTRDAEDFKGKFKGLVDTLKTVTATMHTSLKEGLEVMRGFRDMGVTDPSEVQRLTLGSEVRGRMSGRTGMEMMALGQQGAEMFRGTGISMERGFELNQANVVTVRQLLNQGAISRETIGQAGGENALAQQLTGAALSSFQSAQGRAAMMANFNPATGNLDPNMMAKLAGGDLMSQIAGAANMGPAGLLTFQARQEDIISKMTPQQMQMFGLTMDMGVAKTLRQAIPGLGMEDAIRVAGQQAGKSKAVIDSEIGMLHQDPEKMKEDQQAAAENVRRQAGMEDFRNRFNVGKRVSNALRESLVAPVSNAMTNISTSVGEAVENMSLSIMGGATVDTATVNKASVSAAQRAMGGVRTGEVMDVTEGQSFAQRHWGQSGQALINQLSKQGKGMMFGASDSPEARKAAEEFARTHGDVLIGKDDKGRLIGITETDLASRAKEARSWQSTQAEKDEAGKASLSAEVGGQIIGKDMTAGDVMSAISGVSSKDMGLSEEDFQKKYGKSKGFVAALATRYVNEFGASAKTKENLGDMQNSSIYSDAIAAGAADASKKADRAAKQLIDQAGLYGVEGGGFFDTHRGDLSILFDKGMKRETKIATLNQLARQSGSNIDFTKAVDFAMSHQNAKTDKLLSQVNTSIALTAAAQESQAGGGGIGTSTMGDLSKETTKLLETQSVQLLNNYKALIALQEELNRSMGKPKGR